MCPLVVAVVAVSTVAAQRHARAGAGGLVPGAAGRERRGGFLRALEGQRRDGPVGDGHRHARGGRDVTRGVAGARCEAVGSVRDRPRVPRDFVGLGRVLCAERLAVEEELHADHADGVRGARGDCNGSRNRGAVAG